MATMLRRKALLVLLFQEPRFPGLLQRMQLVWASPSRPMAIYDPLSEGRLPLLFGVLMSLKRRVRTAHGRASAEKTH